MPSMRGDRLLRFMDRQERTCEPWLLHEFEEDFYGKELRLVVCSYVRPRGILHRWRRSLPGYAVTRKWHSRLSLTCAWRGCRQTRSWNQSDSPGFEAPVIGKLAWDHLMGQDSKPKMCCRSA